MSALAELLTLPDRKDNPYIKEWKRNAGRIVGVTCTYAPEEIIYAAGIMPYRMEARGCRNTGLADVYYHRFNCTFARSLLQMGLSRDYNFLDGLCVLNGCEQIRRLYEIWDKHINIDYLYMVTFPHSVTPGGLEWYREEIFNFKEKLGTDFGVRCSDDDIRKAIKVYNETRGLIRELYDMRMNKDVPITGADATRIVLSSYIMPRDKYNVLLREALDEIRKTKMKTKYKARIMVGGACLDDPKFVEMIEDLGALVVADTLCFGSRNFSAPIDETGDPLTAIAKNYYEKNPCPRMMNQFKNRLRYTESTARKAKVDGIILEKIIFCDSHGVDCPMLAEEMEKKGTPALVLDREHEMSDTGRLKTRIEAFLERIAR